MEEVEKARQEKLLLEESTNAQEERRRNLEKLSEEVAKTLDQAKEFYPELSDYRIFLRHSYSEEGVMVIWEVDTQVEWRERWSGEYGMKTDFGGFEEMISHNSFAFVLELDNLGNLHYFDGKTYEETVGNSIHTKIRKTTECILLGNFNILPQIIELFQEILARRIVRKNFPRLRWGRIGRRVEDLSSGPEVARQLPPVILKNVALEQSIQDNFIIFFPNYRKVVGVAEYFNEQ